MSTTFFNNSDLSGEPLGVRSFTPNRLFKGRKYIYTTISCGESEDPCPNCGTELSQDVQVDRAGCQSDIDEPYCEECFWPNSACCGAPVVDDFEICSECKEHC